MRAILGLNYYHNSSAALLLDGDLTAVIEQERLDRCKHSGGFPSDAIQFCLTTSAIRGDQITDVVCSWHPRLHLMSRLISPFRRTRRLTRIPYVFYQHILRESFINERTITSQVRAVAPNARLHWIEHHLSHACSAFLPSRFDEAVVWTVDGRGECSTSMSAKATGNTVTPLKRTYWPNSIGYFYTMFTYYLGFPGWDNEYKVMGLAGYGSPTVKDQIAPILRYCPNSMFRFDASYYSHPYFGDPPGQLSNHKLTSLLGPPRQPEHKITAYHMDVAASAQSIVNDVGIRIVEDLRMRVGAKHLCLAGGVALNGVLNNAIRKTGLFDQIFVQPAAGDAGCALGNVLWCENIYYGQPRRFRLEHVYLGSCFEDECVKQELAKSQVAFAELEDPAQTAAQLLAKGYILGWYQGRSEFGPRALGNRSILADPRSPDAKDIVNAKIKFREEFRPFAPAVLAEDADKYFDLSDESKYMLMICDVQPHKRAEIPAVTHVDGTARVQTVNQSDNPLFWNLINEFKALTGTPVVLNTSFNVKDEPIVDSPFDAIRCFLNTGLDFLIMGRYLASKQQIPAALSGPKNH